MELFYSKTIQRLLHSSLVLKEKETQGCFSRNLTDMTLYHSKKKYLALTIDTTEKKAILSLVFML